MIFLVSCCALCLTFPSSGEIPPAVMLGPQKQKQASFQSFSPAHFLPPSAVVVIANAKLYAKQLGLVFRAAAAVAYISAWFLDVPLIYDVEYGRHLAGQYTRRVEMGRYTASAQIGILFTRRIFIATRLEIEATS